MPTGYVYDDIYQQHDTRDHVEGKDRLTAIDAVLEKTKVKEQLVLKAQYRGLFHSWMKEKKLTLFFPITNSNI